MRKHEYTKEKVGWDQERGEKSTQKEVLKKALIGMGKTK